MRVRVRAAGAASTRAGRALRLERSTFYMAAILLPLGFVLIWPVLLIFILSFNTARDMFVGPAVWGLENWRVAFTEDRIPRAIANTFLIWGVQFVVSMPLSVFIAWVLARTRIPFSHALEFFFWVAYVTPGGVVAWILLLDPYIGYINILALKLPFVETPVFDIFSVGGIIWVGIMGNGIALKVMLLTPAFRNMDAALEEAARVGGASALGTMLRVTVPMMISPIALVMALQVMRIFQSFETELLLGVPIGFFVYSTVIFDLVRMVEPPRYGQATVLASITLVVLAFIIPLQRWILQRRRYTTISSGFRPGLVSIGNLKWAAVGFLVLLHLLLTVVPVVALVMGSFMQRTGFFEVDPPFTLRHWNFILSDPQFLTGLRTTLTLAFTTGLLSPILFSMLAYILVRTRWPGRFLLDSTIWVSAAIPGMLSSLGLLFLFLGTPGLSFLFGTIWALIIVVILQGNTTGVNIAKGAFVQVGFDMEEAARVSGAGWLRTYFRIWLPLLMPTMVLLGTLNFNIAAGTTASIILLASRDSVTLSILLLNHVIAADREMAAAISIIIGSMTLVTALIAREWGRRMTVRHR